MSGEIRLDADEFGYGHKSGKSKFWDFLEGTMRKKATLIVQPSSILVCYLDTKISQDGRNKTDMGNWFALERRVFKQKKDFLVSIDLRIGNFFLKIFSAMESRIQRKRKKIIGKQEMQRKELLNVVLQTRNEIQTGWWSYKKVWDI